MKDRAADASVAPSPEALFRYRLVAEVVARIARGERRAEAIGAVAAYAHPDLSGRLRTVSTRTLYRWLARFEVAQRVDEHRLGCMPVAAMRPVHAPAPGGGTHRHPVRRPVAGSGKARAVDQGLE